MRAIIKLLHLQSVFYLLWLDEGANKGEDGVSSHGHVGEVGHHRCEPVPGVDVEHVPVLGVPFPALHQHLERWRMKSEYHQYPDSEQTYYCLG